jgi:hypothetical protein
VGTEAQRNGNLFLSCSGATTAPIAQAAASVEERARARWISSAPGLEVALPTGKGWNYIDVTTPRTLVEFDVYMKPAVPGDVTFVVYEGGAFSTYTLIASVSTHIDAGTSYKRSGVLNVPLAAGKTYAIGIVSQIQLLVFTGGDWQQAASFGSMSGSDVYVGDASMPSTFDRLTPGMELLREHYLTTP